MTRPVTGSSGQPASSPPLVESAIRPRPSAFTSNLSTAEFAAIRSVGFSPLGFVMGTVVASVGWVYSSCGHGRKYSTAPVYTLAERQQALTWPRTTALARLRDECLALGADGVVGVRLGVWPFPAQGQGSGSGQGWQFLATGTAVLADGPVRANTPFTCDLTAQDFAALLRSGWVPASFVQGVAAVIRHRDFFQQRAEQSWGNTEIQGETALVTTARASARTLLLQEAAACGAEYVVVRERAVRAYELACRNVNDGRDGAAEAFISGTGIVPIGRGHPRQPAAALSIMRLDRTGARGDQ